MKFITNDQENTYNKIINGFSKVEILRENEYKTIINDKNNDITFYIPNKQYITIIIDENGGVSLAELSGPLYNRYWFEYYIKEELGVKEINKIIKDFNI